MEPTLVAIGNGRLVAATRLDGETGSDVTVFRSSNGGATWSAGTSALHAAALELGRLVHAGGAELWLPVLELPAGSSPTVHLLHSMDGGASWVVPARLSPNAPLYGVQMAAGPGRRLVCAAHRGTHVLAAQSLDGGVTWSAFRPAGIESAAGTAFVNGSPEVTLLYTEVPADTALVPPVLPVLRQAVLDGRGTWRSGPALLAHPGRMPRCWGAVLDAAGAVVVSQELGPQEPRITCRAWPLALPATAARAGVPGASGAGADSLAAARALRILAEHTQLRPRRSRRLFVEAYFMRTAIAANDVLGPRGLGRVEPFDAAAGVDHALAFADSLVTVQDKFGYWPLGYPAVWYADMGAAAAVFAAVEPYAGPARLQRYEAAVDRFLHGLAREKMLWDTGAVGLGRELIEDPLGRRRRASPEPYLVSTALVGIEIRAWMYHRTGRPEYRDAALRSLDYTLAQITANGFREAQASKEGVLRTVAYVQEGWMAADRYLDDPTVLPRLRRALRPHVDWLVGLQKPDGTWDGAGEGTFARTAGIVNFFIWYDERCEQRPAVRAAIRRAAGTWTNPDRWANVGLLRKGEHYEVQRALVGRTLAALAAGHAVP